MVKKQKRRVCMKKRYYTNNRFEATIWLMDNLVYCEGTHSFVHRLFDAFREQKPESHRDAQFIAKRVLCEMSEVFEKQCETKIE